MSTSMGGDERFCPHCGKAVASASVYCPFCRYDFVNSRPAAAELPIQQPTAQYTPPPVYGGPIPVHPSAQGWHPPYFSFAGLMPYAVPVLVFLSVGTFLDLVSVGSGLTQARLLSEIIAGQQPNQYILDSNDARHQLIGIAQIGVFF
jgi:hypothetical protein